jgi:hypothetical protein
VCNYTSNPPICLHGAVLNYNFTFYLYLIEQVAKTGIRFSWLRMESNGDDSSGSTTTKNLLTRCSVIKCLRKPMNNERA